MKRFALKTLVLLALVLLLQMAVVAVWPPRIPEEVRTFDDALAKKTDVVFFGDSTVFWSTPGDATTESIATKLHNRLPGRSLHEVSHRAYHLGLYVDYCRRIAASRNRPRLVVVTINMRNFSPHWDMRPEWQFEDLRVNLAHLDNPLFRIFHTPLSIFKIFKMEIARDQYLNTPVYDGLRKIGTVKEFDRLGKAEYSDESMKKKLLFYYMGTITEHNRKVESMRQIVRILKSAGVPVLFYVTPIDYETGNRLLGERFRAQLEENVAYLNRVLREEGAASIDLSCALGTKEFDWPISKGYVDEHLREHGRQFVADRLYEAIEKTR